MRENEPSIRWWNTLSAVRGRAAPRCATGVSCWPPNTYVSVSFATSYRGTPQRVSIAIDGTDRSQPTPIQPLPLNDAYFTSSDGSTPPRPGGSSIGYDSRASP